MRHLVLAGVGHAQLDLLASFRQGVPGGWRVTVITSPESFHYSGLLPAVLAGEVPPDAARIPVAEIAARAGLTIREARVTALDATARVLQLDTGDAVSYDLLSLDVGSVPAALGVPGARQHAHPMRPFRAALDLMARLDAAINASAEGATVPVAVVGAGAAGVEIAFALRARIARADRAPRVTLIDPSLQSGLPLAGFPAGAQRLAARALTARTVTMLAGSVAAVHADGVTVHTGGSVSRLDTVATAWVTGPAAPAWLATSGLACDAGGYPLVDATLALTPDRTAFGGGDCITLRHAPQTPKAGVYAVRMAPIVSANVRAVMAAHGGLRQYEPQADFLALLSTGDGRALLRWRGVHLESRWAQHLKRWIDTRYLQRYRALAS